MAETFNWLHISDLHFGQANQPEVWPNVRQAFFEDLRNLHERSGPWHALIFSGDLVAEGKREEFEAVESEVLSRVFEELRSLGSTDVVLFAVPGSHDLCRPQADQPSAALRQLLRNGGFQEIAEEFWANSEGEYGQIGTIPKYCVSRGKFETMSAA